MKNIKSILRIPIIVLGGIIVFLPIKDTSLFSKYIYRPFFKQFFEFIDTVDKSNQVVIYCLFIALVLFIVIYYAVVKFKKFYPPKLLIIGGVLLVFYIVIRFNTTSWEFIPSDKSFHLAYFDIVALAFLILLVWFTLKYFECNDLSNNLDLNIKFPRDKGFQYDTPKIDNDKDELKRGEAAQIIAERIKNTHSYSPKQENDKNKMGDAFTVGICGEWGSGKTSFLNMVVTNLNAGIKENKDRRIIVRFNPWENHQDSAIISSFFDTLGSSLSDYVYDSKDLFGKYAQLLLDVDVDSKITKAVKTFKSFAPATLTIHELYEKINTNIRTMGYQIVIVIDDLDRLYPKEILEVLKLIRNSANFDNTVFIVTYDKKYILDNIGKEIKNHENYLNKIVQMEYSLPIQPSFILTRQLTESICTFFRASKGILFKGDENDLNIAQSTIKKVIYSKCLF